MSGSTSNVAVVYGTGAGVNPSDLVQAGFVQTNLASSMGSSGGTPSGDSLLLERATNKFNLMNNMSTFYSTIDEGELTTILAKGVYSNDAHDDFDYEQSIVFSSGLQLTHFLDSKFNGDQPAIGFDLASGKKILNYTLKFTHDDAEGVDSSWTGIVDSELYLFSQPYYVLSMSNTTATNHKITLLNSAASATLDKGESVTLTTDAGSYLASVQYLDSNSVKLIINGQISDSLAAGQTQKLEDGSYLGIKSLDSDGIAGGQSYVEFSIGSGKLVLENTKEVEINNEKLSKTEYNVVGSDEIVSYKLTSYITTVGTNLDSIVLDWEMDEDSWIAPGTDIVIPGFETIKISMNEFVTGSEETTTFEGDSSKFEISTTITDGAITLPIFYMNTTSNGIAGLGKDSTHVMATGNSSAGGVGAGKGITIELNETLNSYFVVTWIDGDDSETYAYELESVDEDSSNKTVLSNLVTGGSDLTLDEDGEFDTDGNIKITLDFAHEKYDTDEYVILNISAASTGAIYTNKIVTADGLMMTLPVENSTKAGNVIYSTALRDLVPSTANGLIDTLQRNPTTWTMNVTESDKNGNIGAGKSFTIAFTASSTDGLEPATIAGSLTASTMYETEDGSKVYQGFVPSDLSTQLMHSKPTSGLNDLIVTYYGSETYAEVFLTEGTSIMSGGTGALGNVLTMDTEVSTVSSGNLIVIGGSCINSAAATLLGGAKCTADWTAATGVGSGQFLIQSFGNAYTSGKIALLVAGYETADTVNAVTYLKTNTVDTTAGKKYKGTSSTSAELVVA